MIDVDGLKNDLSEIHIWKQEELNQWWIHRRCPPHQMLKSGTPQTDQRALQKEPQRISNLYFTWDDYTVCPLIASAGKMLKLFLLLRQEWLPCQI